MDGQPKAAGKPDAVAPAQAGKAPRQRTWAGGQQDPMRRCLGTFDACCRGSQETQGHGVEHGWGALSRRPPGEQCGRPGPHPLRSLPRRRLGNMTAQASSCSRGSAYCRVALSPVVKLATDVAPAGGLLQERRQSRAAAAQAAARTARCRAVPGDRPAAAGQRQGRRCAPAAFAAWRFAALTAPRWGVPGAVRGAASRRAGAFRSAVHPGRCAWCC